jgi:anti-anti-sigma regulatory factor
MRIARLANPIISAFVPAQRGPNRTPDVRPPPTESLVFLELSGPLVADTAPALADVVTHRISTPPPSVAAVLDLCGITEFDDAGRSALVRLRDNLEVQQVELHLTATHDVLDDLTEVNALAPALHPAVRVAILAAYAAVPGPAVVTSDVREMFHHTFEPVTLVPDDPQTNPINRNGHAHK